MQEEHDATIGLAAAGAASDSRKWNEGSEKIALLSMPFAQPICPSMAMGLLKSILIRDGIVVEDFYFNLEFLRFISVDDYQRVINHDHSLLGDYVFGAHFNELDDSENRYLNSIQKKLTHKYGETEATACREMIVRLRNEVVPDFLEHLVELVEWDSFGMIGFTSTFQQNAATLAFAKLLGDRHPSIPITCGGANFAHEMGLEWLRSQNAIDYVCFAEADISFTPFVKNLKQGKDLNNVVNFAYRQNGHVVIGPSQNAVIEIENSPTPNYESYYRTAKSVEFDQHPLWDYHFLMFETSRGCWWGQKHHCVFCGLNNAEMTYRSKTPEKVYAELKELNARHHAFHFHACDNILDRSYISTLFYWLDKEGSDFDLFFEVKANMKHSELRSLARAGVKSIQPGIESLNTSILKLMDKGVSGIQNIFILKWARYFGIRVHWNLLWGFYGENLTHYHDQTDTMDLIYHLDPPSGRNRIVLERFSPMFNSPDRFGVSNICPDRLYRMVYTDPEIKVENIAHIFECDVENAIDDTELTFVDDVLETWRKRRWDGASLAYRWGTGGVIHIMDERLESDLNRYVYKSPASEIYEIAGLNISSAEQVSKKLHDLHGVKYSLDDVRNVLDLFVDRRLAIREGNTYLSLAIPVSDKFRENSEPRSQKHA